MNNYELRLEQFSGPLEKLLELIEKRQMEITELSLAEITADFLEYIKTQMNTDENTDSHGNSAGENNINTRIIADFVVIAAQLLLIKSKALLPELRLTGEEEKGIKDLERRLHFYQEFKPAMNYLKKLWEENNVSISRPLFFGRPAIFYPAENLGLEELLKAIKTIFEIFQELSEKSQPLKISLVSLEEKIQEIMRRLKKFQNRPSGESPATARLKFQELTDGKSRPEIIVSFLALLHLLANQLIKVEQKKKFEDMVIKKKN